MPVYSSKTNVKTMLGLASADTSLDALIDLLLPRVDEVIDGELGRGGSLASSEQTAYLDGSGRAWLILPRRPVTAVAHVYVDQQGYYGQAAGGFAAATEWTVGTDFAIPRTDATEGNGGVLLALKNPDFGGGGIWPEGRGNVKAVYTAGYSSIPADLALAADQLCALLIQGAEKGSPLQSETIGRYAYTLLHGQVATGKDAMVLGSIRSALARYAEVNV